ncbi:MAG TPA: dihydropteroate synthase [Mycobacteriales bacterium]
MPRQRTLLVRGRRVEPGELLVMGIINRTPDSFYDHGATWDPAAALAAADEMVEGGADILDVGGVKAGAGDDVSPEEEIRRTAPCVAAVRARHPEVAISVDTWRADVARVLLGEGADIVNDTWGGWDPALASVAAEHDAGLVCAHAGGQTPRSRPHRVAYDDVVADIIETVTGLADRAVAEGVRRERILVDPAHDFGKNTWHSLEVTRRLGELVDTGWPVLVALSRKDFLGEVLDLPPGERLEATLAATVISALAGARVFRAHDVRATRRVLDVVGAVRGTRPPAAVRRALA